MKFSHQVRATILEKIEKDPGSNPSRIIQQQFSITRETVRRQIQTLIDDNSIVAEGYGKGRVYFPSKSTQRGGELKSVHMTRKKLASDGEDVVFTAHIAPVIKDVVSKNNFARIQYISTECLNNIIDHSRATQVTIKILSQKNKITVTLIDDGIGVFASLKNYYHLNDMYEAAAELAKGKRTTDPALHAGEGLFFSARIADFFEISANGISYSFNDSKDDWIISPGSFSTSGTIVQTTIDLSSAKTTRSVFDRYTRDFKFELHSPLLVNPYIVSLPTGDFLSRSEAKKIIAGAESFKSIILDFKNIENIGQGFADEIFRVFASQHPTIIISHKNANEFILRMIAHVTSR